MLKIPYGESNFAMIRNENYLYIDKTHYIRRLEPVKKLIHLRPRRFGKSLFISMLESYYDVAQEKKFDTLFKDLHIHNNPTEYKNSYYILRLNFSGIQNTEKFGIEDGFVDVVYNACQKFVNKYDFNINLDKMDSAASILRNLMRGFKQLELPHKIYVLIDEYDHFTNTLLTGEGDDFLEMLQKGGFVRSFYEVIKEQSEEGLVDRLFITGVMSVTLDSMTSGFNVGTNITTTEEFSDMMGFTSDEVKAMLQLEFTGTVESDENIRLDIKTQEEVYKVFKDNYNGYLFSRHGENKVFNSTLIMHFMKNYVRSNKYPDDLGDDNLNQTGTTITNIVNLKNRQDNYRVIEQIVEKGEVYGTLQPFIKIEEKFDKNDFITLLFNLGMLTIDGFQMKMRFKIPNQIIQKIYYDYLKMLLEKRASYKIDLFEQEDALMDLGNNGEIAPITAVVSEFLNHTSARDKIKFDEKYIKLVYRMILGHTNQLEVYDEFPMVQGYGDLFIQKAPSSTANFEVLVELKYLKATGVNEMTVDAKVEEGMQQIATYLKDERISMRENLRKFVIVFVGFDAVRIVEV